MEEKSIVYDREDRYHEQSLQRMYSLPLFEERTITNKSEVNISTWLTSLPFSVLIYFLSNVCRSVGCPLA